jgi:hypothetical protein
MSAATPTPPANPPASKPASKPTPFAQAGQLARWSARLLLLLLAGFVYAMWAYDRSGNGAWIDSPVSKAGLVLVYFGFVAGAASDLVAGIAILAGVMLMIVGSWGFGMPLGAMFCLYLAAGLLHLIPALGRRLEREARGH